MALKELVEERGVILLGAGKMGGALLHGWLSAGLAGSAVQVVEPQPADALRALAANTGLSLVAAPNRLQAAVVVLAVKPQVLDEAAAAVTRYATPRTVIVSVAAGRTLASLEQIFGPETPIVRSMPNTPASIGHGVSALISNRAADERNRSLSEALLSAAGEVVWLEREDDMDAVTAVSGSGPAYVFHMVEALAAAGVREGLPPDLAMRLARATVSGAGALLSADPRPAEDLRVDVTSPNGTTAAGLAELMSDADGLSALMTRTVAAAARRSRALADG